MLRTAESNASSVDSGFALPGLEAGDHLDQPTFHRLYEASPPGFRAELIEGVVIVPSPTRPDHGDIQTAIVGITWVYRAGTQGVHAYDNSTVLLPPVDEPQPDAIVVIKPEFGGLTRFENGYLTGPPELVIEVAASSVSYDLHSKYRMYERTGIQEYAVAVVGRKEVRWFAAENGRFMPIQAGADGIFRSRVFPGLWLDAVALWSGDDAKVLETVQRGLASPEHAAFVEKLRAQRA
jgi:Uma2 family endonuclease